MRNVIFRAAMMSIGVVLTTLATLAEASVIAGAAWIVGYGAALAWPTALALIVAVRTLLPMKMTLRDHRDIREADETEMDGMAWSVSAARIVSAAVAAAVMLPIIALAQWLVG